MLSEDMRGDLLCAVRREVEMHLCGSSSRQEVELEKYGELHRLGGAFVTIKKGEHLRGCIGNILGRKPLYQSVLQLAVEAAVGDPRFLSMECTELQEVRFELSLLTVPGEVDDPRDIVIGTDGILFSADGRSAVFLPQVAPEQQWSLEQTLDHLCIKAGLSPGRWRREGCTFQVFQAEVFGEE